MATVPAVAVVIPVRDGARHLPGAIASVRAQTLPAAELVVVDDGSSDDTVAVAEALGVRCVRRPGGGAAAARNTGVRATTAPVVAFLDCDDRWHPTKLEMQVAVLESDAELGWVSARGRVRFATGLERVPWAPGLADGDELPGALGSTLVVRRAVFDRLGGFDEGYQASEDLEWLLRSRDAGIRDVELPALADVHLHGANSTLDRRAQERHTLRALQASIARRRVRQA